MISSVNVRDGPELRLTCRPHRGRDAEAIAAETDNKINSEPAHRGEMLGSRGLLAASPVDRHRGYDDRAKAAVHA